MKIKLYVADEMLYIELGIFSFNSYVYYLTRAFNLVTRAFSLLTCGFELGTRRFELVTHRFELVTRNSCLTFPQKFYELRITSATIICSKGLLVSQPRSYMH